MVPTDIIAVGVAALYISTPKRAFHYATMEGVTPWQELIMSSVVTFIALFLLLITNFHHEDRREKIRRAKLAIHQKTKSERDRLRRGVYGDQSTKQARAAQIAKANRRGTQINFGGSNGSGNYNSGFTGALPFRSYRLDQPPETPLPVLPIGQMSVEDEDDPTAGISGSGGVQRRVMSGGVASPNGQGLTTVHGPISAVRPTTQSVDEYHCLVCACIIFVCTVVGSSVSGGFMNPLFVAGLDVLALHADVIPLLGPFIGAGFTVGIAYIFGESANLMNSESQLASISVSLSSNSNPSLQSATAAAARAIAAANDAPRGQRPGLPGARHRDEI